MLEINQKAAKNPKKERKKEKRTPENMKWG